MRTEIIETLPEKVQKLWYGWELQMMVLLSLFFQILLILLGERRKHIAGNKRGYIVWIAYLSADSVATFALGVLTRNKGHHSDELRALWAPFLLLHLGGPDTITAYALEDNDLWLRHLLVLVVQTSMAFFVLFRSWTGTRVSIVTILMFVTGVIKYGERTLALRSASKEQFRQYVVDKGPNYAEFVEDYESKQDEGYIVEVAKIFENRLRLKQDLSYSRSQNNPKNLLIAHELFEKFKRFFADLVLISDEAAQSRSFIMQSSKEAFEVLEIELGFTFDVLYTKAPVVYTIKGGLIRSFYFCLTTSVLVVFMTIGKLKHHYSNSDIIITYLLFIVAVILEIYALVILLFSDWVLVWLSRHKMPSIVNVLEKRQQRKKRWSNSMGQCNLLSLCLKEGRSNFTKGLLKLCPVQEKLEIYLNTSFEEVTDKLKELIFEQLKGIYQKKKEEQLKGKLASGTTNYNDAILNGANLQSLLGWSISDVEFHQSILLWHIATDLCYHSDLHPPPSSRESPSACTEAIHVCRLLSDYMLHLLIAHPIMLPEGIGQIRFRDTCEEARDFFKRKKLDVTNDREKLRRMNIEIPPIEVKGDSSKSVLFDACRLAKSLRSLTTDQRWEIITTVWVNTLLYAASQCKGTNHAKQLGQGGELLTHIWLLMAHLGMTEQVEISQGRFRAQFIFL